MNMRKTSPSYKHYTNCQTHGRIAAPNAEEAALGCPTCRLQELQNQNEQPPTAAHTVNDELDQLVQEAKAVATAEPYQGPDSQEGLRYPKRNPRVYEVFIGELLAACDVIGLPAPRNFDDLAELAKVVIDTCESWDDEDVTLSNLKMGADDGD
jgi:hypothetical protein